ncbi:antibiotic biosynthesis monooxygenase [Cryomorphaceae bacterium 1068]|nr:antibiotic biosynthesis monooxygenase [Cryomorphaceae bacterium 1068]
MESPFSVIVSHFVKPEKKTPFEQALRQVIKKAKEHKGYEGIQTLQIDSKLENEYILMIRFDNEVNYKIWANSDTRKEWAKEIRQFITKESEIRYQEGIEFWFSLPQLSNSKPPKKWKMALLTWMVIYPSVLTLSTLAGIYLRVLPLYIRMLLVSITLVSLMTYVIMPKITTVFAAWIFKKD